MPTPSSSMGQLQRTGIRRVPNRERGVKGMKWGARNGDTAGDDLENRITSITKSMQMTSDPAAKKVLKARVEKLRGELQAQLEKELSASSRESRVRKIRESTGHAFIEQGVDEGTGKKKARVYLVTIIEEGMGNSKDKNYYSAEALQKGAKLFNNSKAYADHPDAIAEKTLPERSMRDLVGWYSDCQVDSNQTSGKARLRGKLHFFPSAKWLTDMIDTILTDQTAKNLFGISINAVGKTRPAQMGGEMVNYVESFQQVDSADVVTEPAARGRFEKILESRRGSGSGSTQGVNRTVNAKLREAGLQPKKLKQIADSLTAASQSDSPDEMKQALYDASRELYAASSISGKGPGQPSEEEYSNTNPVGGMTEMAKTKVKTSRGGLRLRKKKHLRAAAGTGPDNEQLPEPNPEDTPSGIREADVEDEEGQDLGDIEDFGDSSKVQKNKEASRRRVVARRPAREDEGLEDEDEGAEDEDEVDGAAPMSGPGSSRMVTAGDEELGDDEDLDVGDDLGGEEEMESEEDEDEDEEPDDLSIEEPEPVVEARGQRRNGRRPIRKAKEASLSGGLGKSGPKSLPSHANPSDDYDEDYTEPSRDRSTSAQGKSYKLKTSRFSTNKPSHQLARKVAVEANRRIDDLEDQLTRLRESNRGKERVINRYKGIVSFHNTKVEAKRFLREAVTKEILPSGYARSLEPRLYGMKPDEQIREINIHARLLESAQDGVEARLMENVDGIGVRGGAVSRGTAGNPDSELIEAIAADGVPMKETDDN